MAERYDFALVPAYLTGYRQVKDNMSSDALRMLRSRELCMSEFLVKYPELGADFRRGRSILMRFMLHGSLRGGGGPITWALLRILIRHDPFFALRTLAALPLKAAGPLVRRLRNAAGGSERFFDWREGAPDEEFAAARPATGNSAGHQPRPRTL
jgi:hypothetical protein